MRAGVRNTFEAISEYEENYGIDCVLEAVEELLAEMARDTDKNDRPRRKKLALGIHRIRKIRESLKPNA